MIGVEPVTVIRKEFTGRDELGRATELETELVIQRCIVAPRTTERKVNGVTEYVYDSLYSIYFPAGTLIKDDDMFIIRGDRYWKDGNPRRWDLSGTPFNPAGVEVQVRTVNGDDK